MADLSTIKNWFRTGQKPTESQFWQTWDSFWHKSETIPQSTVQDLESTLDAKAEKQALQAHIDDPDAHGGGSGGVQLGETDTTAHRGDHGKAAYDHSLVLGNPHATTKAQVGLGSVNNTSDADKPVSTAQAAAISAVATASVVSGSDSNTTIKNLSTVASYPATPVANSLYFVETSELEAPISVTVSAGTTVTIAHGQSFVPSFVSVQAKNATARGTFSIDVDGTNITLTYASAITAGTAEYWLRWKK